MTSTTLSASDFPHSFRILDDFEGAFCKEEVLVRLIHFWEARNFNKGNTLIGLEMLLLDKECNAVQGFISANRLARFQHILKANSVYKLRKFIVNLGKKIYKVTDHQKGISFTDQTAMVEVLEDCHLIDTQKFRIRTFNELAAIVDTNTDLYDTIWQLRLISGDNLHSPATHERPPQVVGERSKDRVFLHLNMKGGETVRIYLWGDIAAKFRERWNKSSVKPVVLLLTNINPKKVGGNHRVVTLSSTSATRLFFDTDIAETIQFITWLNEGGQNAPAVTSSSSAITKLETVTINEIHQFLQTEEPQVVSFYCVGTIVDVLKQYGWYYISCSSYNTKLGKSETSLFCNTCKKTNNVGLLRYRFEISVCDKNKDIATFIVFDKDGTNLFGKKASEVLNITTEDDGTDDHAMNTKIPDCLKQIIGRTCKFQIKLTSYNFSAPRQTIMVSHIVEHNVSMQANASEEEKKAGAISTDCETTTGKGATSACLEYSDLVKSTYNKKDKRPRLND